MPSPKFAKGNPKPANSGRKKGVGNKRTAELVASINEICAKHGVCPIEGMAILSKTTDDDSIRFQCYKELASYMYAKRARAVELTGPDGKALELNNSHSGPAVTELIDIMRACFNERNGYATK